MSDQFNPEGRRRPGRPSNAEIAERQVAPEAATPRQEETQQRRRRREGLGPERNLKMHIPESAKDPNFEYRWANDQKGRIHQLTIEDDWEVAPDRFGGGLGTASERVVDKEEGRRAVLLRKPKNLYLADKAEEAKLLDQQDDAMRRGPLPTPEGEGGDRDKIYTPGGRNTINGR